MSTNRKTLRLYWAYTNRHKALFWLGAIGAILAVILQDIIPPFIVSRSFNLLQKSFSAGQHPTFSQFLPYFIAFSVAMLLGAAIWRIQGYCIWKLEIKARREMAVEVYDHLQHQSQRFHADRFGGALVSQTNKFMSAYERLLDEFIWSIVPGITAFALSIGVLMFISYRYALVLLFITLLYMLIMFRRVVKQMPYNLDEAKKESLETAALADAITNVSTIRAFASEAYELMRFKKVTNRTYEASRRLSIESLKTDSISHFQTNTFHILAFLFGLVAITSFNANVSVLYLILSYTQGVVGRLWLFSRIMRNINRSFGDAAEMTEILDLEQEIKDPPKPEISRIHRGEIVFDDVSFFYPEDKKNPLFDGLNLKVKPGEKIGLVGPSGGGKTTFTRLLLRFMDIQSGKILIDGQDIAAITQTDLRSSISYVSQEPLLFHRSLAENIQYGDDKIDQKVVEATAKMAHAHEFIERLPNKYETLVGERGIKLSGGQRQRIAIARAMIKNSPILVLDEATSALDSDSEQLIQSALWKLMEGRTAIVIAHRLSTIQKMDRIVVLDKGKIVEQGSHKELLSKKGPYAELWSHQSGGFLED